MDLLLDQKSDEFYTKQQENLNKNFHIVSI